MKYYSFKRFWEIDFLRGLAIIMMIVFHFFFDLDFFNVTHIDISRILWLIFARSIAIIFIFLVGLSLTISYNKTRKILGKNLFKKYLLRGFKIFGYGLIITLITFIFLREGFIIFGILHFIGVAIILAYPFLKLKKLNYLNFIFGIIFIIIGLIIKKFKFDFYYFLWLGLIPKNLYTFDYFPLLPWFGIVLIGIFLGNILYKDGKRNFKIFEVRSKIVNFFCFLGRHSLIIYLLHQPILSGLILIYVIAG